MAQQRRNADLNQYLASQGNYSEAVDFNVSNPNIFASVEESTSSLLPTDKLKEADPKSSLALAPIELHAYQKAKLAYRYRKEIQAVHKALKAEKINQNPAIKKDEKSQVLAFILCLFFGLLGIHRFYLGYNSIGTIMFFTLGCCGVLTLIDLVRILTGDLKAEVDTPYIEKIK